MIPRKSLPVPFSLIPHRFYCSNRSATSTSWPKSSRALSPMLKIYSERVGRQWKDRSGGAVHGPVYHEDDQAANGKGIVMATWAKLDFGCSRAGATLCRSSFFFCPLCGRRLGRCQQYPTTSASIGMATDYMHGRVAAVLWLTTAHVAVKHARLKHGFFAASFGTKYHYQVWCHACLLSSYSFYPFICFTNRSLVLAREAIVVCLCTLSLSNVHSRKKKFDLSLL
jgi:hypothetical protein